MIATHLNMVTDTLFRGFDDRKTRSETPSVMLVFARYNSEISSEPEIQPFQKIQYH